MHVGELGAVGLKRYERGVIAAVATTTLTLLVGLLPFEGAVAQGVPAAATTGASVDTTSATATDSASASPSTTDTTAVDPRTASSSSTPTATPTPTVVEPHASPATVYGAPGQTTAVNVLGHDSCNGSTTAPCPYAALVGSRLAVSGAPAVDGVTATVTSTGIVAIAVAGTVPTDTSATFKYTIHDQYGTATSTILINIGAAPVTPTVNQSVYTGKSLTFDLMALTQCNDAQSPCPAAALTHIFMGSDPANRLVKATATTDGQVTITVDAKQPQFRTAHIPYVLVDKFGRSQGILVVTVLDSYNPGSGIIFNNPLGSYGQQQSIDQHVIDLVNHAPKGATINLLTYTLDGIDLTYALVNAYKRGVAVRVLQGQGIVSGNVPLLQKTLGTNPLANSFYHLCYAACRANHSGVPHTKVFEVTRSGRAQNIVVSASSNFSYGGSTFQWFDAYQLANNQAAFDGFAHVFAEARLDKQPKDWTGLTYNVSSTVMYIYPRIIRTLAEMAGTPPKPVIAPVPAGTANDWLERALSQVGCTATTGYGANGRTVVRASVRALQGARGYDIAKQFGQLAKAGCDVRVITTEPSTDAVRVMTQMGVKVGDQSWNWRYQACSVEDGVPSYEKCWVPGLYTHMHALMVSGQYGPDKTSQANLVWTGSESWNTDAYYNDEEVVRLSGAPFFTRYSNVFNYNWSHYTHRPGLKPLGGPPRAPVTYP